MRWIIPLLGVVAILLGGLWLLQGLGIVQMQPILCVADCETVEGPSVGWAIAGAILFLAGCAAIYLPIRRHRLKGGTSRRP